MIGMKYEASHYHSSEHYIIEISNVTETLIIQIVLANIGACYLAKLLLKQGSE